MAVSLLHLRDVALGYNDATTWHFEENYHFQQGELVALVGRNGAGKSTFLRTLTKLQLPIHGHFSIQGKPLHTWSAAALARMVSVVNTQVVRVPYLTVRELVALGRYPYTSFLGALSVEDWQRVDTIIEQLDLQRLAGKYLTACSDGERQLAMLARAVAQDAPIILMDEVTAHLDFINRQRVFELLRKLCSDWQKLIFIATHELDLATHWADSLLLFRPPVVRKVVASEWSQSQILDLWATPA